MAAGRGGRYREAVPGGTPIVPRNSSWPKAPKTSTDITFIKLLAVGRLSYIPNTPWNGTSGTLSSIGA